MMKMQTWKCGPPSNKGQRQQYPGRFEYNLRQYYPQVIGNNTLHMFSGARSWGITTDIREGTGADHICPFTDIPLEYDSVDHVIADPPYADFFQKEWGGDLPKPKHVLREAVKFCKPGGLILILHIIVIPAYKVYKVRRLNIHPVLAGPNNVCRVLNVFQKSRRTRW